MIALAPVLLVCGFASDDYAYARIADPVLRQLETKLQRLLKEPLPGVVVRLERGDHDTLRVEFKTQKFTVHGIDKTGEINPKPHETTGPGAQGLVLEVRRAEGAYQGPAIFPQSLREPYWTTFFDAVPVKEPKSHLWVSLSYGCRFDPNLMRTILAAIDEFAGHTRPATPGAATE